MTSSNEQLVPVEPFKCEERYIVVKRKHLTDAQERNLRECIGLQGIGTVECVVVESDWPEYEAVWQMIEERVTGNLAALRTPPAVEPDARAIALLDLLAVIHRDGGHKVQEIGWKLAFEQAMEIAAAAVQRAAVEPDEGLVDGEASDGMKVVDVLIRTFEHWLEIGPDKQPHYPKALRPYSTGDLVYMVSALRTLTPSIRAQALEEAARVATCAFDDRPNSRAGHHSEMDWTDGFRDGTKAAAAAIRTLLKGTLA